MNWNQAKVLKEIKRVVAYNILLAYPDFNNQFEVYTDASDFQLGAVILRQEKPIYLYIIKLTNPQKHYMVT